MRVFWKAFLPMALVLQVPGTVCASTPQTSAQAESTTTRAHYQARYDAWKTNAIKILIRHGSADSLVAAAGLITDADGAASAVQRRLQWLDRAAALEPRAADIAAQALRLCTAVSGCDVAAHVQRVHRIIPDDAGYLLPALDAAYQQHDASRVTAILQRMAKTSAFESYYVPLRRRVWRGIQSIPPPPLPYSGHIEQRMALTSLAPFQIPGYGDLARACKPAQPTFAARRAACLHLGQALNRSSDLASNYIGLAIWRKASAQATDRAKATQRLRRLHWLSDNVGHLEMQHQITAAERFRAVLTYGSEVKGMLALLTAHHLPTRPPADWIDPAARDQTGQAHAPTDVSFADSAF